MVSLTLCTSLNHHLNHVGCGAFKGQLHQVPLHTKTKSSQVKTMMQAHHTCIQLQASLLYISIHYFYRRSVTDSVNSPARHTHSHTHTPMPCHVHTHTHTHTLTHTHPPMPCHVHTHTHTHTRVHRLHTCHRPCSGATMLRRFCRSPYQLVDLGVGWGGAGGWSIPG